MPPFSLPMKLTLNSVVPSHRRGAVEQLLTRVAPGAKVCWLPSRFPRLVMLVEPGELPIERSAGSSIFDEGDMQGVGDFSAELEDSIQRLLAGSVAG